MFFKLGVHIEQNGHLNWHVFLCQSLQKFDSIYIEMVYKVISLTIITINSTIICASCHSFWTCYLSFSDCFRFCFFPITKSRQCKFFFYCEDIALQIESNFVILLSWNTPILNVWIIKHDLLHHENNLSKFFNET